MVPVMTRRRPPAEPIERSCLGCSRRFQTHRPSQRYHSVSCRSAAKARERRIAVSRMRSQLAIAHEEVTVLKARVFELETHVTELQARIAELEGQRQIDGAEACSANPR
jgi:hypothetical protein